jgi:hypothetical protein
MAWLNLVTFSTTGPVVKIRQRATPELKRSSQRQTTAGFSRPYNTV